MDKQDWVVLVGLILLAALGTYGIRGNESRCDALWSEVSNESGAILIDKLTRDRLYKLIRCS